MSIWNKILLTLIFFASLAFFYAAARMVRTYQYWAGQTDKFEQALTDRNGQIVSLRTADHEHPLPDDSIGVLQLRIDLGRVLANRGRVWTKWEKQKAGPDPQKAGILDVTIATDESVPSAFTKNMLVYAFEEGDDQPPGKYLGEFRVVEISERQIVLASTTPLVKSDNPELKVKLLANNVLESRGPWVLYELMPTDEHEAFTNLTEDDKKWVPDDFSKDGQAGADDKRYVRTLRDYLGIFRDCETYRTLFADRMVSDRTGPAAISRPPARKPTISLTCWERKRPRSVSSNSGPTRSRPPWPAFMRPCSTCSRTTRPPSMRRLPRTTNRRRKLPGSRKKRSI